jgi:two-component system chemotaxis response regulator CheB
MNAFDAVRKAQSRAGTGGGISPREAAPREVHGHDVVVIGCSAGGVEAVRSVVSHFPETLEAAVFVVLHIPRGRSVLPEILSRSGPLPATHPADGDKIQRGTICMAPPDHHLLIQDGRVRLARGPLHKRHRPAIDPLFWSAAASYSTRVVGVVLTGTLDDGTAGLASIKERGGIALVQDPATAAYSGMPESALAHVNARRVPLADIGLAITRAVAQEAPCFEPPANSQLDEVIRAVMGESAGEDRIGTSSMLRQSHASARGPSANPSEES